MDHEKPTSRPLQSNWQGTQRPSDGAQSPSSPQITIIGMGEIGNTAISQLDKLKGQNTHAITISPDFFLLKKLHREEAIRMENRLDKALDESDLVLLATCLNNDLETKIMSKIARAAKKKIVTTIGVAASLPHSRGDESVQTSESLRELQEECDMFILVNSQDLMKLVSKIPLEETKRITAHTMTNVIIGLVETFSTPALPDSSLNSFRTFLGSGGLAVAGIGESDLADGVEKAVYNALENVRSGQSSEVNFRKAKGAFIHVAGSTENSIEEATRMERTLQELMEEKSSVFWEVRVNPDLKGRIRAMLVMAGPTTPAVSERTLGSLTGKLHNLELNSEPDKELPIDFQLYQMENF
jgi:cell division GTPase FtsZ